jgi:protein ImuA
MSAPILSRSRPYRPTHPARAGLPFLGTLSLARGRCHEVCGPARRVAALMLAAQCQGPVIWIAPGWEKDRLHPEGIRAFCPPGRLIFVQPRSPADLLWALEEVLRSGEAALCVAELPDCPPLTPVRRLHLAAQAGAESAGTAPLGLLLTPGDGGAQGVETRWHMAPALASGTTPAGASGMGSGMATVMTPKGMPGGVSDMAPGGAPGGEASIAPVMASAPVPVMGSDSLRPTARAAAPARPTAPSPGSFPAPSPVRPTTPVPGGAPGCSPASAPVPAPVPLPAAAPGATASDPAPAVAPTPPSAPPSAPASAPPPALPPALSQPHSATQPPIQAAPRMRPRPGRQFSPPPPASHSQQPPPACWILSRLRARNAPPARWQVLRHGSVSVTGSGNDSDFELRPLTQTAEPGSDPGSETGL